MTAAWDRESFISTASRLAADARARGEPVAPVLSPLFHQALFQHPDEEDRLLELWDELTARQVL